MSIQSISVVVPTKACVNNCEFCVSKMHSNPYEDKFDEISYRKRIKRAAIENVTTMIITGTGEALQNTSFLRKLKNVLDKEGHPFPNVELQTSGVMLMKSEITKDSFSGRDYMEYPNVELLKELGVNTISLSVSDIFISYRNLRIMNVPSKLQFDLDTICKFIKDQGFNLRLSLNMTNVYDDLNPKEIIARCKELGADQITFRKLYGGGVDSPEARWVLENSTKEEILEKIKIIITVNGKKGFKLPFGAWVYSILGMSVAIDDDCMASEEPTENLKYVILRENGKLYWAWNDEGSLIF